MNKKLQPRSVLFAGAAALSIYVSCIGTLAMGFCSESSCLRHTIPWTLLAPSLLLAIWSIRANAVAAVLLLAAHVYIEVQIYGGNLNVNTLWGTDHGIDKCFWLAVFSLIIAACMPDKAVETGK